MAFTRFQMESFTTRNGDVCFYWVDKIANRVSRWWWESQGDALQALGDGIEWEPR